MADETLSPPRKSVELQDPGAHNLDSSDESSDQFTDASEGRRRAPSQSSQRSARSPIPVTRVERVDDEPAYGEVPGTDAYNKRTFDAVPDEVEVISRSRSASRVNLSDRPRTPSEMPIPKIVALKIDPDQPAYGDVPGTDAYEKRRADAVPDVILKSPDSGQAENNPFRSTKTESSGSPTASLYRSPLEGHSRNQSHASPIDISTDNPAIADAASNDDAHDDTGFGDDFDDFEEGEAGDDDDFGDFDDGFQEGEAAEGVDVPSSLPAVVNPPPPWVIPAFDWSEIDSIDEITAALGPYTDKLYPDASLISALQPPSPPPHTFLSDRRLSLYQQLVAPPPLAPPNWLRSRIRRLFLVSLGVPVDLDEILPASKQKKLILPSFASPRGSTDSRRSPNPTARLKGANDSSVSVDSWGNDLTRRNSSRRPREVDSEPTFESAEAVRLGATTIEALAGMGDEELQAHVKRVEEMGERAREALGYWERRREGAVKEKEAFEGVIENLVKHARKVRK
ncbi:hypothetical protein BT63DRAFT_440655 [Microthyrium microscopicum]|uniref:Uncharacterized protein n=1 Tax=Microthyrium microscopicum TaxID=703497 RepID=A0A6A6UA72_9PEZI|nr:hypothetical protein BT63DRAFT_440655 [Microthyrium microscopicum]